MATLTLTAEEKAVHSFLELDDESLGKLVKKTALIVIEKRGCDEKESACAAIKCSAAAFILISECRKVDATSTVIEKEGVTCRGEDIGNWRITVEKI